MDNSTFTTLFKSDSIWIINKPIRVHFDEIITQGTNWEPVHRLDFETSGVLLFATSSQSSALRRRFKDSSGIQKTYVAGALQKLPEETRSPQLIEGFIGSRYKSSKKVKFSFQNSVFQGYHSVQKVQHKIKSCSHPELELTFSRSLSDKSQKNLKALFEFPYEIDLISGARHQIRAYFAAQACPLKGDPIYHPDDKNSSRLALHAASLKIAFENGGDELFVQAPLEEFSSP